MPILDVEVVLRPGESLTDSLAAELADRAAVALNARPAGTWVKLHAFEPAHYAEGGGGPPPGVYPVFVSVIKAELPVGNQLLAEISTLTQAIAEVCGRPAENVHVLYQPAARGRVAFGGRLV